MAYARYLTVDLNAVELLKPPTQNETVTPKTWARHARRYAERNFA